MMHPYLKNITGLIILFTSINCCAQISEFEMQKSLNESQILLKKPATLLSTPAPHTQKLARIDFLNKSLSNTEKVTDWHYAWSMMYGGGVFVNTIGALTSKKRKTRVLSNIRMSTSALALLGQTHFDRYPELSQASEPLTASASHKNIQQAENLLRERAEFTAYMKSYKSRIGSYAAILISSILIKEAGYEEEIAGGVGLSLLGIELNRRMLSTQAIDDWSQYKTLNTSRTISRTKKTFSWQVKPQLNGITFTSYF